MHMRKRLTLRIARRSTDNSHGSTVRSRPDGEEAPVIRDAFEFVLAFIIELEAGSGYQVHEGPRSQRARSGRWGR